MDTIRLLIGTLFSFLCFETSLHAQNAIVNNTLCLTDSLIVNGAFVNPSNNLAIIPDISKTIKVVLHDELEGCTIDNKDLTLKYSTDSTEYDNNYLSVSMYWRHDEFGIDGSPSVEVMLVYYSLDSRYDIPTYYQRYYWGIICYIIDDKINHYRLTNMAE